MIFLEKAIGLILEQKNTGACRRFAPDSPGGSVPG